MNVLTMNEDMNDWVLGSPTRNHWLWLGQRHAARARRSDTALRGWLGVCSWNFFLKQCTLLTVYNSSITDKRTVENHCSACEHMCDSTSRHTEGDGSTLSGVDLCPT